MGNEFSQDAALVNEFLVESEELLQGMDQDMVALESSPRSEELLNRIFRAMHTIKGTSGFLGFEPVVRLAHLAEEVLNQLRQGEIQLNPGIMNALLAARDQFGRMLADIREGGLREYQLDHLIAALASAQLSATEAAGTTHSPAAAPPPETEPSTAASPDPAQLIFGDNKTGDSKTGDGKTASTMRVDVRKLDDLIDLVGELVLERNRLVRLNRDFSQRRISHAEFDAALSQSTARLSFITEELQVAGLRTRMVPMDFVFKRFPRLVRDVAHALQKQVQLVLCGEDTELDKTMVELVADPLVHLVRNALDHGIEPPSVREACGKPCCGIIKLEARQEADQIVIVITDDGAGLDPERIAAKAVAKGLVTAERIRGLGQKEIFEFIFLPGFSTAEKTSDLSGRGVGMDVVRSNLKKLNGTVDVSSRFGHGTSVQLRLPLTLAILPLLLVEVQNEVYGLPLRAVLETARIRQEEVHRMEGAEVLCLRGETLPLLRLQQMFGFGSGAACASDKVVVLGVGEQKIAVLVDHLLGQESTVIKPLGPILHRCANLAGATISGDGRVRLVLDPASLLWSAVRSATETVQ